MKKVKLLFLIPALFLAVGGAWATKGKKADDCFGYTQYYLKGGVYFVAIQSGVTYVCAYQPLTTCTYYKPNPITQPNTYVPCQVNAVYTPLVFP